MAVFVAAGDESDGPRQDGAFLYGGFVAPLTRWQDCFTPAWEERVLNGKPPIPYMHMVEIRSASWRAKHGISYAEAERRVDEATRVIGSSGFLHPLRTLLDGGVFREVFGQTKVVHLPSAQPAVYRFEPDYIGFLGFAYAALEYVGTNCPDAEKVDFVIERKSGITHHIADFIETLAIGLKAKKQQHLIRLIGELIPGGKDRVPLQAADVAMWHWRRYETRTADAIDLRRMGRMFNMRYMTVNEMSTEQIMAMGLRSKRARVASPFKKKPTFKRKSS